MNSAGSSSFTKRVVVFAAALLEVGGEVLVGVAATLRAYDPDLLAAQPIAQRLEGRDLIDLAHHPLPATLVLLVNERVPVRVDAGVHRDRLAGRVLRQALARGVPRDQLERIQDRPVDAVVRAELERLKQADQPAAVVRVGRP